MAFESLKIFRNFGEAVGGDCGFEGVGFVQLVGPQYAAALARNVARQQRLGITTKMITPAEVREILPGCEIADVGAAAWEADSGFADPAATAFAFAEAARNRGATIETGVEVLRVLTDGGRVMGVETSAGRIATPKVVIVAGAWAGSLLTPLGLDYGLAPHRIQVSIFRWPAGFTQRHPAVIDAIHKAWWRPEARPPRSSASSWARGTPIPRSSTRAWTKVTSPTVAPHWAPAGRGWPTPPCAGAGPA